MLLKTKGWPGRLRREARMLLKTNNLAVMCGNVIEKTGGYFNVARSLPF